MQQQDATSFRSVRDSFDLTGRVAVITGGAGRLGTQHAAAVAECGGIPVLLDLDAARLGAAVAGIQCEYVRPALGIVCDVSNQAAVRQAGSEVFGKLGRVDILINNAANDPKVTGTGLDRTRALRLESFDLAVWEQDIAVGLTGALLCCQVFGQEMARQGRGVILNVASDLSLIAPDQRLYRVAGLPEAQQPVKPVTYSVIKAGLIGLTRYLATYWAQQGVRVNSISPGGVHIDQDPEFVTRLSTLIPLGRMARPDEYKAAVAFLVSDASSYMTGSNLVIDGGRTCW